MQDSKNISTMKQIILKITLLFFAFSLNTSVFSQAKKPILMIMPSKNWCDVNGFTKVFDNQGSKQIECDYEMAFIKNSDLKLVIAKISGIMKDRGFPTKDLEQSLTSLKSAAAEEMMTTSKTGSELSESPLDKLKKVAKADIIMELTWTVNERGPFKSVSFNLRGLDAYTNKQVAVGLGTGPENGAAIVPVLLETAVLANIDNFNSQLQSHFDDLFENGREVVLKIRKFESFDGDLEKEYEGEELNKIIQDWVSDNTVKGRFETTNATENMMDFEQVRIPLYDEKGRATDARNWARGLQKLLKEKYKIEAKLAMRGLGEASIIVGEK